MQSKFKAAQKRANTHTHTKEHGQATHLLRALQCMLINLQKFKIKMHIENANASTIFEQCTANVSVSTSTNHTSCPYPFIGRNTHTPTKYLRIDKHQTPQAHVIKCNSCKVKRATEKFRSLVNVMHRRMMLNSKRTCIKYMNKHKAHQKFQMRTEPIWTTLNAPNWLWLERYIYLWKVNNSR